MKSIEYFNFGAGNENVLALRIHGEILAEDMDLLFKKLGAVIELYDQALLYVDLRDYEECEHAAAKGKLAHLSNLWSGIKKAAYIIDKKAMTKLMLLVDEVTPMNIRGFDDPDEARDWLLSKYSDV